MRLLEPGPLEELRLLDEAGRQEGARLSAGLRESIEAAALILGVRESVDKAALKEAHRKIMLMNHPDRGGSPFIATKINEANECLSGQGRTSGSAFS